MSVQNLDRVVDAAAITTDEFFKAYEINDSDEQQLLIRLFKRLYYKTIERRYGSVKSYVGTERPDINLSVLSEQLEINPRLVMVFGVITSFKNEGMVPWVLFVQIMATFLLRKNMRLGRIGFMVKFLRIKSWSDLKSCDHLLG